MTAPLTDRRAEAERLLEERTRRRVRRTPYVVLALLVGLVLAVGVTAAVDLRRLDTPRGAALSWTEAAVFGDCDRFLLLSARPPDRPEPRSRDEVCAALADRTRELGPRTRVRLVAADRTSAYVVVDRPDGPHPVRLALVDDGRWKVRLDEAACDGVGCP